MKVEKSKLYKIWSTNKLYHLGIFKVTIEGNLECIIQENRKLLPIGYIWQVSDNDTYYILEEL